MVCILIIVVIPINIATCYDQIMRITLDETSDILEGLNKKYTGRKNIEEGANKSYSAIESDDSSDTKTNDDDDDEEVTYEVAKEAHNNGDHKKAWDIFKRLADKNDFEAVYYVGYYYYRGYCVNEDKELAKYYFKKAADNGDANGQLRYAFCLKEEKPFEKVEEFKKYLQMSADNGNITAIFNLGIVQYKEQIGYKGYKENGLKLIVNAAKQGQKAAINFLEKENIPLE